jgi:hypothetical protein
MTWIGVVSITRREDSGVIVSTERYIAHESNITLVHYQPSTDTAELFGDGPEVRAIIKSEEVYDFICSEVKVFASARTALQWLMEGT